MAKTLAENLEVAKYKHTDFMGAENSSTMYLKYIELFEIMDEIKKICVKKAMGFDEIAPKVIKWPNMVTYLHQVFVNRN